MRNGHSLPVSQHLGRRRIDSENISELCPLQQPNAGGGFYKILRVRARFSVLGCTGATSPLYKGRAPSPEGCHGCHKGATPLINSLENFLQNIIGRRANYHRKQQILQRIHFKQTPLELVRLFPKGLKKDAKRQRLSSSKGHLNKNHQESDTNLSVGYFRVSFSQIFVTQRSHIVLRYSKFQLRMRGTLVAPVAPSQTGCKPCVYGRCGTRAPSKTKFSRARAQVFCQIFEDFCFYGDGSLAGMTEKKRTSLATRSLQKNGNYRYELYLSDNS